MAAQLAFSPAERGRRVGFVVAIVAVWTVGLVVLGLVERQAPPRPGDHAPPSGGAPGPTRPAPVLGAAPPPAPRARIHRLLLGRSVQGRPIGVTVVGDPRSRRAILVVGCIHGDEPAGIAITRRLEHTPPLRHATLWLLDDLNPDGVAARTRQNAHGVDLNRNFPYGWRRLGARGDQQYSGPRPLSEPESRLARRLILRVSPRVTIWFHQPVGVVDLSGGDERVERRFAALSALPVRRLERYPGSAPTWQNHIMPGTTAFVVELPSGRPSARRMALWARAVRKLASTP